MDQLRLKSALDLREEPHACKKAAEHNVITGVAIAPVQVPLVGDTTAFCCAQHRDSCRAIMTSNIPSCLSMLCRCADAFMACACSSCRRAAMVTYTALIRLHTALVVGTHCGLVCVRSGCRIV